MQIDSSGRARTSPPTPSSARRSTPWTPTDLTRSRFLHARAGFDFAVVEECAAYEECSAYTEVYGDHVLAIDYTDNLPRPWDEVCADPETPASVVLRDRDLVTPDDPEYVFETCG